MAFLVQRVAQLLLVLCCVALVTFLIVRLTGDPAVVILGQTATPEALAAFRQANGLNAPIYVQFERFVLGAVRGDLGVSLRYQEPVLRLFFERFPATVELTGIALLVSVALGIPMGIVAAVRRNTPLDVVVRGSTLLGQAVPGFYLGLMSIIIFGATLRWLPTGGRGGLIHLILPTLTLSVYLAPVIARFARGTMLEVLGEDYVRTARAKGVFEARVLTVHALRNALIPVVTFIGLQAGGLLSGAIITETVFSWPGVGRLAVDAIYARDFPVVQATVLVTAALFVVLNLAMDILYLLIDPRIRYESRSR